MADGKHVVIRIIPQSITDSMRELGVPAYLRAGVREVVKLLHAMDQGDEPEIVMTACRLSFEHGKELCPHFDEDRAPRGRRDLRCKCARYWRAFLPGAA